MKTTLQQLELIVKSNGNLTEKIPRLRKDILDYLMRLYKEQKEIQDTIDTIRKTNSLLTKENEELKKENIKLKNPKN